MNNKWYKVIYEQIQPIHIGANSYGVIKETRIFIPGITMWGALTNAYVKSLGGQKEDYKKYQEIFENITCFYPMIDGNVLLPRYEDGEFFLGYCSQKEFRKEFTTTYLSTSIFPSTLSAQDESLHEIDVVLPEDKENESQLYWVGYLKIDDKSKIPNEIYVGGDSRYGFGLMQLVELIEEDYPYEVKKGVYQEKYPHNEPISNFVLFKNQLFDGELEIFAEFDFTRVTPTIQKAYYVISVGSTINSSQK